jgi:hypothetical protein
MGGGLSDEEKAAQEKAQLESDRKALAATAAPSVSDQAIRDAILAERNKVLTGTSRRAAYAKLPGEAGYHAPIGQATIKGGLLR